jgi:hypothetical protein
MSEAGHQKDQILDQLATRWNVAQFVSFDASVRQRHAWIHGHAPNVVFESASTAVAALLQSSPDASVNVRTFHPDRPKSRDFVYGVRTVEDTLAHMRTFSAAGLHTIVNETVDVEDGGVSGVAFGNLVEFAPGDTPRCVEKPGTAALPRATATALFRTAYGFAPDLPGDPGTRVEFSIHPLRRGYRHDHTIVWEVERRLGVQHRVHLRISGRLHRGAADVRCGGRPARPGVGHRPRRGGAGRAAWGRSRCPRARGLPVAPAGADVHALRPGTGRARVTLARSRPGVLTRRGIIPARARPCLLQTTMASSS